MDQKTARETDTVIANLIAQTGKLNAETGKICAEARWYPVLMAAGLLAAGAIAARLFL